MPERTFKTRQLRSLVRRRAEISDTLIKLWRVFDPPRSLTNKQATLAHLLLGAAFSLWRGAFLIKGRRKRSQVTAKARQFLGTLLADNAIAYAQDRDAAAWTAGYYVNNALHRLRSARGLLTLDKKGEAIFDKVDGFMNSQEAARSDVPDLEAGWRDGLRAVNVALTQLEGGVVKTPPRPRHETARRRARSVHAIPGGS